MNRGVRALGSNHLRDERPLLLALIGVTGRQPGDVLFLISLVRVDLQQIESLRRVTVSLGLGAFGVQAKGLVHLVTFVVLGHVLNRFVWWHASCLKMLQCLKRLLGIIDAFEDHNGDSVKN